MYELARVLGFSEGYVGNFINAKEFRDRNLDVLEVSTTDLAKTRTLPDDQRVEVLEKMESGKLKLYVRY